MDPYPNEGTFYQPVVPEQTQIDNEEELKRTAQVLPALNDALNWFDEQIAECDSIEKALVVAKERELPIEQTLTALSITKRLLEEKKQEYANLKLNLPQ